MSRLYGIMKAALLLGIDFAVFFALFQSAAAAALVTVGIALYTWLGGYLALWKDGGVAVKKLSAFENHRLEAAKAMLVKSVPGSGAADLSKLKLYLTPSQELNATAYGANVVSVNRGALNAADPMALCGVLAHEASHILHWDAEINRIVFATVTVFLLLLMAMSAAGVLVIFLIFLILNCFRSFWGILAFRGTTGLVKVFFSLIQRALVFVYRAALGICSRRHEMRADRFAAQLGYGLALAHFLSLTDDQDQRRMTLTEVLYRSHPPTEIRIRRLEEYMRSRQLSVQ